MGITQSALAQAIGASLQTIKSYEGGRRIPSGEFAAGLARLGINLHWMLENDGPMLLEGERRKAQLDLLASAFGDEAAVARMQVRVDKSMSSFNLAFREVDDAARRCQFALPSLTRQALVLAIIKGMAYDGIEPMIQLLKAQSILDAHSKSGGAG